MQKKIYFLLICFSFFIGCATTTRQVSLLVSSEPKGAKIYEGGKSLGYTPRTGYYALEIDYDYEVLTKSTTPLTLVLDGYKPQAKQFWFPSYLRPDERGEFSILFIMEPVEAPPKPQQQQQQQQQHQQQQVVVVPQAEKEKEFGFVSISSEPVAEIYLNGSFIGMTPMENIRLQVGQYKVDLMIKGYKTWTRQFQVLANTPVKLKVTLEKE